MQGLLLVGPLRAQDATRPKVVRLSAGCWMSFLPRAFLTTTLVMALEENGGDGHRWEEAAVLDACN